MYTKDQLIAYNNAHFYSSTMGSYEPLSSFDILTKEFNVAYKIDKNGYLGFGNNGKGEQNLNSISIGDSFPFGYGVEQTKNAPFLLNSYNAALWGTSFPVHAKAYEKISKRIPHKYVIWFIYPPHLISVSEKNWSSSWQIEKEENRFAFYFFHFFNTTKISNLLLFISGFGINTHGYFDREIDIYKESEQEEFEDAYQTFSQSAKKIFILAIENNAIPIAILTCSKTSIALKNNKPILIPARHLFENKNANLPYKKITAILKDIGYKNIYNSLNIFASNPNWEKYYFQKDAHWNHQGHQYISTYINQEYPFLLEKR